MATKRLYRSSDERMVAGVCGGLAEYFDVDPTVVRVAFVLLTIFDGAGLALYILMWIIVPERHEGTKVMAKESVKAESVAEVAPTPKAGEGQSRAFWGIILVVLGGVLLLEQIIPWSINGAIMVPTVLVAVGLVMVARSFDS
jgi:phage shock protein C